MTGGQGRDVFIWNLEDLNYDGTNIDIITDFDPDGSSGDQLDIGALLESSDFDLQFFETKIDEYVRFVVDGADTVLEVKIDGAFTPVVKLQGITGPLNAADMQFNLLY